jgi:hypothetical protein
MGGLKLLIGAFYLIATFHVSLLFAGHSHRVLLDCEFLPTDPKWVHRGRANHPFLLDQPRHSPFR